MDRPFFRMLGTVGMGLVSAIALPLTVEAEGILHLDGFHGQVQFESQTYYQERERASKYTTTETILREELTVGTSGWLYDPSLLQFDGSVSVIPEQQFLDSDLRGKGNETGNWNFLSDIFMSILPKKSYPMTFRMSQNIIDIRPPLRASQKTEVSQYETTLALPNFALGKFDIPTHFTYQHGDVEMDQDSIYGSSDSRTSDDLQVQMGNSTGNINSRLEYRFETLESERNGRKVPTQDRHRLNLYQDQGIANGESRSRFYFFDYQDGRDVRTMNFDQDVRLDHGEWVSSHYRYTYDHRESESNDQDRHQVSTYLRHQWYDSLTSQLELEGNYLDSDTGEVTVGVAELSFYYTKIIPGGYLGLHLIPRYSYHDEEFKMDTGSVLAELHSVDITQLMPLRKSNVLDGTLQVLDPVSLTLYDEGPDYTVIVSGVSTALEIVPGGNLDPGFTTVVPPATVVSVSYDYDTGPSRTYSNVNTSSGLSLDLWDNTRFDITYIDSNAYVREEGGLAALEGRKDPALEDFSSLAVNLEYRFLDQRLRFEYRDYDELINPRTSYSVKHYLSYRSSGNLNIGSTLTYYREDEDTFNRSLDVYGISLTASAPLPNNIRSKFSISARRMERWDQELDQANGSVEFIYRYGLLLFELEDQFTWERSENVRGEVGGSGERKDFYNRIMFRVTRPF